MSRAFAGTLATAALLHAGLLLAASRLGVFQPAAAHARAPQQVSIELLAQPKPPPREPAPAAATTGAAPAEPGPRVASYVAPRAAPHVELAPPGASAELPTAPAPGELPAPAGGAAPLPHHPINLGLGGDIYWMMHKQHPGLPDRAPPRRAGPRTAGALAEGLEARDHARGHFRGGAVADAAREVANRLGPQQGRATFVVETDPHGHVRSVRMVGASADVELWNKVAGALREALLRRAALRVPPGAGGLRVSVLVEARMQLPSGASPGGSVHFKGAGLGFDVADIDATPRRVVYARITSEVVL